MTVLHSIGLIDIELLLVVHFRWAFQLVERLPVDLGKVKTDVIRLGELARVVRSTVEGERCTSDTEVRIYTGCFLCCICCHASQRSVLVAMQLELLLMLFRCLARTFAQD